MSWSDLPSQALIQTERKDLISQIPFPSPLRIYLTSPILKVRPLLMKVGCVYTSSGFYVYLD